MLPGILDGGDRAALEARALHLLGTLGLAERATHRPEAMSGGEQQRVAIARALLFEPPVLFADEPTGALDSANSERMWRMLDELARERRMVVLMVTHEPAAAAHCRHVFVIRDGVVAGGFETKGMNASDLVVRASGLAGAAR
jgi:putative ABC transport system ATP-binding protein